MRSGILSLFCQLRLHYAASLARIHAWTLSQYRFFFGSTHIRNILKILRPRGQNGTQTESAVEDIFRLPYIGLR